MRTIRQICLTALVLIGLCGVATYFATSGIHDPHSSSSLLFAVAWIFSGLGIAGAAVLVGCCMNMDEFGTRKFIGVLFGWFAGIFAATAFLLAMAAAVGCSYDNLNKLDGPLFGSVYCPGLAGLVIGFFGILLVNARESWVGEQQARTPTRLRNVS